MTNTTGTISQRAQAALYPVGTAVTVLDKEGNEWPGFEVSRVEWVPGLGYHAHVVDPRDREQRYVPMSRLKAV